MGRAAWVLLVLLALPPGALAQSPHEDFSRASDDYGVLRLSARHVLSYSTEALNLSLEQDHDEARGQRDAASSLSLAMADAAALDAAAATSTQRLAPLASAAEALSGNVSALVDSWAAWSGLAEGGFTTRPEAIQGQLLLGALREGVAGGLEAADAYERLEYDVTALREALRRFLEEVERQTVPVLDSEPALFLEAFPAQVPYGKPLTLRGLLVDRDPAAGRPVRLLVDGEAWAEATTDSGGYFSVKRVIEPTLAVGAHEARARAATRAEELVSDAAVFHVAPIPTRLLLSLPTLRLEPNVTVLLSARLVDDEGRPVAGPVPLALDGAPLGVLDLGPSGAGALPLSTAGLALGPHVATARFAGDAIHAPSEATLAFEVAEPRVEGRGASALAALLGALAGWLAALLAALVVLHALALRALRGRGRTLWALAGPLAVLALGLVLAAPAPLLGAATGAAALASLVALLRGRREKAPPRAPPVPPAQRAPEALAEAPEASPARPATPLDDLLDVYRALLARLSAEGVDVRPLTHREVAHALRARSYPDEAVRALTHALERALYAGQPPRAEDVPAVRAAFGLQGAAS